MDSIAALLTFDHRECETFFAELESEAAQRSWETVGQKLAVFQDRMHKHFEAEEESLFPAMERKAGQPLGPTMVMRSEHQQMRGLFGDLDQACSRQDAEAFLGASETLMILMQQHSMKEEQILYPMAESSLGPEGSDIVAHMKQILGDA
jgi:hemerythrin-like domain-containing protein